MKKVLSTSLALSAVVFAGCSAQLSDYPSVAHPFDLKDYFSGEIVAWGIVQDYRSQVTRQMCVEITGTWQENKGELAETFYFDDGEISYRTWQLTKTASGDYLGEAADVIGVAVGQHQGMSFQLNYDLALTIDDSTYQVSMDDWMYQLDEHRVMNKTAMKKWGVTVANITLFFDKQLAQQGCKDFTAWQVNHSTLSQ
jgi:hypothetical protein